MNILKKTFPSLQSSKDVTDPELWNALKAKYEKSSALTDSCMNDAFRKRDHDEHPGDDTPLEGEKGAKRQKTSRSSKSARGSLSKQPAKETNTSVSELPQQQSLDAWIDILVIDEDKSNPNERPRYLYNKDLFFLKNGTTKEKKYVLSLYKIHATLFPEEDFEEKMIR
ncbi:hypothetical protein Tco_1170299 [Tanacetum coccineum]